jgi:hypothetical protein
LAPGPRAPDNLRASFKYREKAYFVIHKRYKIAPNLSSFLIWQSFKPK